MSVHYLTDQRTRLLAYRFSDDIRGAEVIDAVGGAANTARPMVEYRSLLVFASSTQISDIGPDELRAIRSAVASMYARAKVRIRIAAIVVDRALDASAVTPLWKSVCEADPRTQVHYRFFIDVAEALAWLDVVETPALTALLNPQS